MKKIYLLLSFVSAVFIYSCNDDTFGETSSIPSPVNTRVINKSGNVDGVNYSLRNLSVNPDLVKINSENAAITSSENEMKNGNFRFKISSSEVAEKLASGNIILVESEESTYLRKITTVNQNNDDFTLKTTEAYIGDLFNGGSIELSIDTKSAERAVNAKNVSLVSKRDYTNSFTFDIFEHLTEFKSGGFTLNPNTSVSSTINMKLGFGNSQMIPNEMEVYYQLNTSIKPYFLFEGSVNKKYNHDLATNIPDELIDLLKKIEIDLTIPTGSFLGDIPAKVSINQINFPMEVEANISKASHFSWNASGTFKIGFAYYNGIPGKTNHFIYENSITNSGITESDLVGEVISDMKISITPKVTLFDTSLIDVSGNISFGVNTFTIGNGSITQPSAVSSKGNFYSSGVFSFGTLGVNLYTTELFKENKELWNIGNFNQTLTFSNLRTGTASILPCSGLTSFNYDVILDYKYPISGKILTSDLEMTYDVYADNGTLLESNKTIKISPNNITASSFTFNLCIPFRRINIFSISKTSYIRNITIKDSNGYTANGITDPVTGTTYPEIRLNR